ncbi:MAG: UbiX family flavin prenyltransferase [Chitinophagales bacterium]
MAKLVIAITGASGVVYGIELVNWLIVNGHEVHLIISDPAKLVIRDEMDWIIDSTEDMKNHLDIGSLYCYENGKIGSVIASGSFLHDGMVVVPCSMSTLAGIANGNSKNLVERSADVTLKEGRRLILVPRETPLNRIHLRNMLAVDEAGARIVPAMPAFYSRKKNVNDLVNFMVGKILDALGIENQAYERYSSPKDRVIE